MAMNNVFYRFRHVLDKETYNQKPARLRMQKLANPQSTKINMELFSLAVSAVNGCEMCMRSHESVLTQHGLDEGAIFDAIRIAATIRAAHIALI